MFLLLSFLSRQTSFHRPWVACSSRLPLTEREREKYAKGSCADLQHGLGGEAPLVIDLVSIQLSTTDGIELTPITHVLPDTKLGSFHTDCIYSLCMKGMVARGRKKQSSPYAMPEQFVCSLVRPGNLLVKSIACLYDVLQAT